MLIFLDVLHILTSIIEVKKWLEIYGQKGTTMKNNNWDAGIDYYETYDILRQELESLRDKKPLYKYDKKRYAHVLIYLTQLRNGCRIGEALDAIMNIKNTYRMETWVKVEKRRDNEKRCIILPEEIAQEDINKVLEVLNEIEMNLKEGRRKRIISRLSTYIKERYGFNSHSLRYAYITLLSKESIPPQLISKITGHADMDNIITYTQEKLALEILKNIGKRGPHD